MKYTHVHAQQVEKNIMNVLLDNFRLVLDGLWWGDTDFSGVFAIIVSECGKGYERAMLEFSSKSEELSVYDAVHVAYLSFDLKSW